jgi:hypothetical protein
VQAESRSNRRGGDSANPRPTGTSREAQIPALHRSGNTIDQAYVDLRMPVTLLRHILDEERAITRSERRSEAEQFSHGIIADRDWAPTVIHFRPLL